MADEIPTADWPTLFRELPVAIRQLCSYDAHGSIEAARLLGGARGILHSVDETYAYEEVVHCLGNLAQGAVDRGSDAMSVDAAHFLHRVAEAFDLYSKARQEAAMEMLSEAA